MAAPAGGSHQPSAVGCRLKSSTAGVLCNHSSLVNEMKTTKCTLPSSLHRDLRFRLWHWSRMQTLQRGMHAFVLQGGAPLTTRARLAGISISLATWQTLPMGVTGGSGPAVYNASHQARPQQQAAVSPTAAAGPVLGAVSAPAPEDSPIANGGSRLQPPQPRDHTGEASRRRKNSTPSSGAGQEQPNSLQQRQQRNRRQFPPTAKYVLLQQWGAEVKCLLLRRC